MKSQRWIVSSSVFRQHSGSEHDAEKYKRQSCQTCELPYGFKTKLVTNNWIQLYYANGAPKEEAFSGRHFETFPLVLLHSFQKRPQALVMVSQSWCRTWRLWPDIRTSLIRFMPPEFFSAVVTDRAGMIIVYVIFKIFFTIKSIITSEWYMNWSNRSNVQQDKAHLLATIGALYDILYHYPSTETFFYQPNATVL